MFHSVLIPFFIPANSKNDRQEEHDSNSISMLCTIYYSLLPLAVINRSYRSIFYIGKLMHWHFVRWIVLGFIATLYYDYYCMRNAFHFFYLSNTLRVAICKSPKSCHAHLQGIYMLHACAPKAV